MIYSGGGYIVDLGYFMEQVREVISDLQIYKWVDQFICVIFVEFSVFNVLVNFFSSVIYLVEFIGIGGFLMYLKVDIFCFYQYVGFWIVVVVFSEFVVIVIVVIVFYVVCKKIFRERKGFFKKVWNVVDVVQIGLFIFVIVLFFI